MTTIGEIAAPLGRQDYAAKLTPYAEGAKRAYLRLAELDTNRQASWCGSWRRGSWMGAASRPAAVRSGGKAALLPGGDGLSAHPLLLPVLTKAGEAETAYKMPENTEKLGWLADVLGRATTIWENWAGSGSRNHYSPGAVCQWLFDTCAGTHTFPA